MPSYVDRQSVVSGRPRPADRRLPLHHQPSACLHMSTDKVLCQVVLGLPTDTFPFTTNLVHAFTCRQTECSARSSSACRQAPSFDHQPSACFHMSTDRVFGQVFLGLPTGAFPSTTNLVHAFTCRQTHCSARSSSACRQALSLDHQHSACFHMSRDRVFCPVFLGLPTGAFPSPPT